MGIPFGAYELLNRYLPRIVAPAAAGSARSGMAAAGPSRKCLMFGRAKMSLTPDQVAKVSPRDGIPGELFSGWADAYLQHRGFDWVRSLDYADFEGAAYQWNLNTPLGGPGRPDLAELDGTIDLILDYGTSEHVFNPGMSFFNAARLLRRGGVLNTVLPVLGYGDHGMYQFNPSFFYAVDRPEFRLEALYFFAHDAGADSLVLWDGLSDAFREHVHGAFDGSYAANCLQFLNEPIRAWALFRKGGEVDQADFMNNTQQLIYKSQWAGNRAQAPSDAKSKVAAYELKGAERAERLAAYVRSIAMRVDEIEMT